MQAGGTERTEWTCEPNTEPSRLLSVLWVLRVARPSKWTGPCPRYQRSRHKASCYCEEVVLCNKPDLIWALLQMQKTRKESHESLRLNELDPCLT